jgi:hypothetical protein
MSGSCLPRRHPNVEEAEDGIVPDPDSVYAEYRDPRPDSWDAIVLPLLRQISTNELARALERFLT